MKHTELDGINTLRYLTTCSECPEKYPTIPSLEEEEIQNVKPKKCLVRIDGSKECRENWTLWVWN